VDCKIDVMNTKTTNCFNCCYCFKDKEIGYCRFYPPLKSNKTNFGIRVFNFYVCGQYKKRIRDYEK